MNTCGARREADPTNKWKAHPAHRTGYPWFVVPTFPRVALACVLVQLRVAPEVLEITEGQRHAATTARWHRSRSWLRY
jgi:hypothetical protein